MDGRATPRLRHAVLVVVLVATAAARIAAWPAHGEVRDCDEAGYMLSGLAFWEGMPAGYCASPAGPQHWTAWGVGAVTTAVHAVPLFGEVPLTLWPVVAADSALFALHEDLEPLRRVHLAVSLGITLLATGLLFSAGLRRAGLPGAVAAAVPVALLPLLVEHAAQARPYADAWHLGLAALAVADGSARRRTALTAGVLFGLSVASRIDMLLLAPAVIGVIVERSTRRGRRRRAALASGAFAITMLIVVPWSASRLLGNVRVGALAAHDQTGTEGRAEFLAAILGGEALLPLLLLACAAPWIRGFPRTLAAWGLGLALLLVAGEPAPLRYSGACVVALTATASLAAAGWATRRPLLVALLLAAVAWPGLARIAALASARAPQDPASWIEREVAPGATVRLQEQWHLRPPLPTAHAARAAWIAAAGPEAFGVKFRESVARRAMPSGEPPRAFSEDFMSLDRCWARRWWILGGGASSRPRYDVRPTGMSPSFGERDPVATHAASPEGVLLWRGEPPRELGAPDGSWGPVSAWAHPSSRSRSSILTRR